MLDSAKTYKLNLFKKNLSAINKCLSICILKKTDDVISDTHAEATSMFELPVSYLY